MATLTDTTLRETLWDNFNTFLNSISFTSVGTISIKASFNDSEPDLPLMTMPSQKVSVDRPTLDGSVRDRNGVCEWQFYSFDPLILDRMIDQVYVALQADTALEASGIQFKTDYWRESESATFMLNNKKIHSKIITLLYTVKNLG
jgi:hypothetical protein